MSGSAQERTEKATPRRIEEARRKGQVAKSTDLTGAFCVLIMVALVYFIREQFFLDLQRYLTGHFSNVAALVVMQKSPLAPLNDAAIFALKLLLPFFGVAMVAVIAVNLAQVGFLFAPQVLQPKFEKLNPLSGLQQMFSMRSLMELIKSVLKFSIIGFITYFLIRSKLNELILVFHQGPGGIYQAVTSFILTVAWWAALAYLALSLLDYMYQRYDYQKSLRMSKQEVKEEFKQSEGDPLVKSKQRELRRSISLNKIISEVPQATVVVTNPTHIAVALRYRQGEMPAPLVVARGAGWMAERIKEIASENGVPVIESKDVARFLYNNVEPGQEIPLEIYQAVAEILALVYRLKGRKS